MKLRILHVLPSLNEVHGGPLRLVLDLSARSAHAHDSEVAGVGVAVIRDNPLPLSAIHSLAPAAGGAWSYSPELRNWLRANLKRFDGVVIHGAWQYPGWAASTESLAAGVPYVYFPHGMLEHWAVSGQGAIKSWKKRLYWRFLERRIADHARTTCFTTEREWNLTQSTLAVTSSKAVIPVYGIDQALTLVSNPARRDLVIAPGERIALYLSRLHPKKNPGMLLKAWQRAKVAPEWKLWIAGTGDRVYVEELHAMAQRLGLGDSVRFTGFVTGADKLYLLQNASWFLLPSSQENFGIAVLEAIQNGCAVAVSNQVYLTESFPADSEILPVALPDWTEFFRSRMADEPRRQRIREGNRTHLVREFAMDRVVEKWCDLFRTNFPARQPVQ